MRMALRCEEQNKQILRKKREKQRQKESHALKLLERCQGKVDGESKRAGRIVWMVLYVERHDYLAPGSERSDQYDDEI